MPEVVKYGISNLTLIGGFPSLSSASTLGRPKWARIKYSFPPWEQVRTQTVTLWILGVLNQTFSFFLNKVFRIHFKL